MLEGLFTVDALVTFLILTALETVLGFDNLLYISIESKKVDPAREAWVRRTGIMLAIGLRIVLLFVVLQLIAAFQSPFLSLDSVLLSVSLSGHAVLRRSVTNDSLRSPGTTSFHSPSILSVTFDCDERP